MTQRALECSNGKEGIHPMTQRALECSNGKEGIRPMTQRALELWSAEMGRKEGIHTSIHPSILRLKELNSALGRDMNGSYSWNVAAQLVHATLTTHTHTHMPTECEVKTNNSSQLPQEIQYSHLPEIGNIVPSVTKLVFFFAMDVIRIFSKKTVYNFLPVCSVKNTNIP